MRTRGTARLAAFVLITGCLSSSCGSDGAPATPASVSFDVDTIWAPPGESSIVRAFAKDSAGNPVRDARITWTLRDSTIARVAPASASDSEPTASRVSIKGLKGWRVSDLLATLPNGTVATVPVKVVSAPVVYDLATVLSTFTYETGSGCPQFYMYCNQTVPVINQTLGGTLRVESDSATAVIRGCTPGNFDPPPSVGRTCAPVWQDTMPSAHVVAGANWEVSFLYRGYGPLVWLSGKFGIDSIVGSVKITHSVFERSPWIYAGTFVARRRR
ncbi:hypothetical protein BH09GEM1_BH09GEM1_07960 [soil metagenome]